MEVKKYECEHCGKEFKRKDHLKKHMANKHDIGVVWHNCEHCNYKAKSAGNLKKHMANKHDIGVVWHNCEHCNYKAKEAANLKKHLAMVHDINVVWYNCEHCNKRFKDSGNLKNHMANVHDVDVKWHHCEHCNYKTKEAGNLKQHVAHVHDIGVVWYNCEHCNYKAKKYESLKIHMAYKHDIDVVWHNCECCDKRFKDAGTLKTHMAAIHDIGPYTCDICMGACGSVSEFDTPHGSFQICRTCYKKETGCRTRKELRMRNYLLENEDLKHLLPWLQRLDSVIGGNACTRYRPDALYVGTDLWIQVECDEHQHNGHNYSCEQRRISEIFEETDGKPLIVIRWNPDNTKTHKTSFNKRLESLRDTILEVSKVKPKHPIEVLYMFYERDNDNICKDIPIRHVC